MGNIINPLTVGYQNTNTNELRHHNRHSSYGITNNTRPRTRTVARIPKQDGYISSILIFMLVTGGLVALSFSHWLTEESTIRVKRCVVDAFLTTIMLGSIVVMLMWSFAERWAVIYIQERKGTPLDLNLTLNGPRHENRVCEVLRNMKRVIRSSLPILGVIIFFLFGLPMDIMIIIAHAECFETFGECDLVIKYSFNVVYHIVRIFFMGTETFFCVVFYNRALRRCPSVHYGLLLIATTTLALWFDSVLYDSFDQNSESKNECRQSHVTNKLCVEEMTRMYNKTSHAAKYLYAINIQFFLLTTESIMKLFFAARAPFEFKKLKEQLSRQAVHSLQDVRPNAHGRTSAHTDNSSMSNGNNLLTINELQGRWYIFMTIIKYMCRLTIVCFNVTFLVMAVVTNDPNGNQHNMAEVYQISNVVYLLVAMILCVVGYVVSMKFHYEPRAYSRLEMTVLLSTMGVAMYLFLYVIADFGTHSPEKKVWAQIIVYIISVVALVLQTNFMIHASRINRNIFRTPRHSKNIDVASVVDSPRSFISSVKSKLLRTAFKHILFQMAMFNIALWIMYFINLATVKWHKEEAYEKWFPVQCKFYSKHTWRIILDMAKPILLFYHFNSFIIYMVTFLKQTS